MSYIGENYDSIDLADLLRDELVGHRIIYMNEEIIKLDNGVTFIFNLMKVVVVVLQVGQNSML